MMPKWLDAREAAGVGLALADQFDLAPAETAGSGRLGPKKNRASAMEDLLSRADADVRGLRLNFYKKARFANSFKWRLIERGVEPAEADIVTQSLILHLARNQVEAASTVPPPDARMDSRVDGESLLARANKALAAKDLARAVEYFEEFVSLYPSRWDALSSLGVVLYHLRRYVVGRAAFSRGDRHQSRMRGCPVSSCPAHAGEPVGRRAAIAARAQHQSQVSRRPLDARSHAGLIRARSGSENRFP